VRTVQELFTNCKKGGTEEGIQILLSLKLASQIESGIDINETYSEVSRSRSKYLSMYSPGSEYFASEYILLLLLLNFSSS
jgi:hypothetical protein